MSRGERSRTLGCAYMMSPGSGERLPLGIEGGEGDDATGHVSFVVPLQVRLPRALSLELDAPLDPHFCRAGVRLQVEPHGHAGVLPALEGGPHGVQEARLEVGDGRWGKKHAYRTRDTAVPAVQN